MGLLIFNMAVTGRMTDPEYQAYSRGMRDVLRAWGDRAIWLEVENVRGEMFSATFQLAAHRVKDGELYRHVMANFDFTASRIELDLGASREFLKVVPATHA